MNSRVAVAIHILALIDQNKGEPATSEYIAGSVNTNPSLVRRMLGMLAKAGLTTSQFGMGGGALLAKPSSSITLLDVYHAVGESEVLGMHREPPSPNCPVGRNIEAALTGYFADAARALEQELEQTTVADVVRNVRRHEARST